MSKSSFVQSNKIIDLTALLLRIGISTLMLVHGIPKMEMLFSPDTIQFPAVMGMDAQFALGLTVFAEVFCSILLLLGFQTRLATVPLIITMLVAVLYVHGGDPFAKQELGIMYLLVYVVLLLIGGGRYSVDYLLKQRKQGSSYVALAS